MAYKKGGTSWYSSYREAETGKKREAGPFETKVEAEAWALDYRARKKRKDKSVLPTTRGEKTFADAAEEYFIARTRRSPQKYVEDDMQGFDTVVMPTLGDVPLKHIRKRHLQTIVATCESRGNKQNSIKRRMTTVMAVLNFASENGWMDPIKFIVPGGQDQVVPPPTWEEVEALLSVVPDHIHRAILLAYYTGARPGRVELLQLQWTHVDWQTQSVRIVSANKGGLPFRDVPLHTDLIPQMQDWYAQDKGLGHIVHYHGRPIKVFRETWNKYRDKIGLRRELTPYSLRHAFATNLIRGGADPASVAYLMGHSNPSITLRAYRHVATSDAVSAIQKLRTNDVSGLRTTPKIEDISDVATHWKH